MKTEYDSKNQQSKRSDSGRKFMTFPTQVQVELRLKALRDQREAIDRDISDCLAFLELGQRLETNQIMLPIMPHDSKTSYMSETGKALCITSDFTRRRRGRAIIDLCVTFLREVGRPMHASELLDQLRVSGFEIPGLDPIASLNTRLWKRSGANGPFRRLGHAVYDLARGNEASSEDRASHGKT